MAKFNFTKAAIDRLPVPDKGWSYHYDLKVQGLGIGIGKSGKKTFILYRKINGRPERVTLGPYPGLTIEQARGKASEMNAAIANGANPAEVKRGRDAE
ncbi:MAG: recombinase XerD, partial [Nitrosospira multiformis]|nr:recombinase XerD [Nitrosospira multiformis]